MGKRVADMTPEEHEAELERGRQRKTRTEYMRRWREQNPEAEAERKRSRREQDRVLSAAATVSGPYTTAEDAVVMDPHYTARQVAAILGRTVRSVRSRRERLGRIRNLTNGRRGMAWPSVAGHGQPNTRRTPRAATTVAAIQQLEPPEGVTWTTT